MKHIRRKRIAAMTAAFALLSTQAALLPQSASAAERYLIGDTNSDGKLTAADLTVMKQVLLGQVNSLSVPELAADTSGDGVFNVADAVLLQKYLTTEIREFPAGVWYEAPDISYPERYWAIEAYGEDGVTETTNEGFEGQAYWNYTNVIGSALTWTVNVPADGNYRVTFRYANGTDVDRPLQISVNGASESVIVSFPGTGAWSTWATQSVVLTLKAGENTIRTVSTTDNGGPNMDYIELEKTDDPAAEFTKQPKPGAIRMENLDRGVIAANTNKGILVSWRILGEDDENTRYEVYKNGQQPPIFTGTAADASSYLDASGTTSDSYTVDVWQGDTRTEYAVAATKLTEFNSGTSGAYFDIKMDTPAGGTTPDGVEYTYTPNDASVGDVDGDGVYEIFLKWDPSNSKDNANDGYTGSVIIDCYKLNGTRLWRIDLGKNIRAGAHYTQFMVYDFDGDNCAEMICKTADGSKDGQGNYIGDSSKDYRSSAGRILTGPEYITLFDGKTGAALDTQNYVPGRGTVGDWGDTYGNRCDRFTGCVAYLGGAGSTASAVFGRGYYTRLTATAWDVQNKKLVQRWAFDTGNTASTPGYGDGNHHCLAADVDGDGKQEVVCGSAVIDDNGKLLYTTSNAHGDAIHIGDLDPTHDGLEIFQCLEDEKHPNGKTINFGVELRDAKTGTALFRETAGGDTGRALADNIIPGNQGAEMVGSHNSVVYDCVTHEKVCDWSNVTKWGQNSLVFWDGDLEREVLDRTMVDGYNKGREFTGNGVTYNNYSKSNACLTCDLFGDWREELIMPLSDATGVRVFTTTYTTDYGIVSLMHNPQYRVQVAAQNNGYNQPPHLSYFLGTGFEIPENPSVYTE